MRELWPFTLTWEEVDPAHHPFVARGVAALVRPLVPAKNEGDWETAITEALVARFGRWACGWRWARDEGTIGGGPVGAWCCPSHSLSTPEATADRIEDALGEWRRWLETLDARFATLAPRGGDVDAAVQSGVVSLVGDVVAQTSAGDAWYNHCAQVLGWYLERCGVPASEATSLIERATGGRFESWCGPPPNVTRDVAAQVAAHVAQRANSP
jgi:hypothetical protein